MSNTTSLSTFKPVPLTWVEKLFERFEALYGNKFLDMWRDTNAEMVKALWAEEMGKLSADELKRGYAALMSLEWPPTLPQFVKLCRPSIDHTIAYYEAINGLQSRGKGEVGTWSHPAIFWAAVGLHFDLLNQTYSSIKTRWNSALDAQMAKGSWDEIPKPSVALPAPGSCISKEQAEVRLSELGVAINQTQRGDGRDWARKILARAEKKDKYLTITVINMAKEALGITKESA